MVAWQENPAGFDRAVIGRVTVIVWTGSPALDLDRGFEVCDAWIPIGDRQYPDGLMLVGRRTLDTRSRSEAREIALSLARAAMDERGL